MSSENQLRSARIVTTMQTESQSFIKQVKILQSLHNTPLVQESEVLCCKYYCLEDTKIKASEQ